MQFDTIHPLLDGNGRLGRLLITFLLCAAGVLREPILYLSLYFKQNRLTYYDLLNGVRVKGDWEAWLEFFLTGVRYTAEQAAAAARRILAVFKEHRQKIEALGRSVAIFCFDSTPCKRPRRTYLWSKMKSARHTGDRNPWSG